VKVEDLQLLRDRVRTSELGRRAGLDRLSQSAASQRVREMEKRLGVSLRDRRPRPAGFSHAVLYLEFCCDVLRREERLQAEVDGFRAREGVVRVACIYSVGLSDTSRLRAESEARLPEACLNVEYLRPDRTYGAVAADSAGSGVVSYREPAGNLTAIPRRGEPMVVAMAPSAPLSQRETLRPADLKGLPFVAFDRESPGGAADGRRGEHPAAARHARGVGGGASGGRHISSRDHSPARSAAPARTQTQPRRTAFLELLQEDGANELIDNKENT